MPRGAVDLVLHRTADCLPRQLRLARRGIADGHGGCGGRRRLGLAADDIAVPAGAHVVHRFDPVVVGLAHRRAGVGIAGGRGRTQQAVAGAAALGAKHAVGRGAADGVPCQLRLAAVGVRHGHGGGRRRQRGVGVEVRGGDGILVPEVGVIFVRYHRVILTEFRCALQEIAVIGLALIPCSIQTVVLAVVHPHDVPCVVAACRAGDKAAVDARVVSQPVKQGRISVAHRRPIDDRSISGILQQVAVIAQMGIVVPDISGDPVIDGLHLLIGALSVQRQLGQERALDVAAQRRFLLGCGEPVGLEIHGERYVAAIVPVREARVVKISSSLPAQIVAAGTVAARMLQRAVPDTRQRSLYIGAGGQLQAQWDRFRAGEHLSAHFLDRRHLRQICDTLRRHSRRLLPG